MLNFSFASLLMAIVTSNLFIIVLTLIFINQSVMREFGFSLLGMICTLVFIRMLFPFEFAHMTKNINLPMAVSRLISFIRHPGIPVLGYSCSVWDIFVIIWGIGFLVLFYQYMSSIKDTYNFIPPFVLTKILTFGVISRYYGLLKQSDRQDISKYFKISDKLLKQILVNLTMIRNISAHSDRLFCYRNKYYISFKNIDKNYKIDGNFTNIYMIIQCMKVLLDENKFDEFENLFYVEVGKLKERLHSIDINDILRIMGFNV